MSTFTLVDKHAFVDAYCSSEPFFWSTIRDLTDPNPSKPKVSLDDLSAEFERRAHIPDTFPPEFETLALELAALECNAIPSCTTDRTPRRSFSRHFVQAEIIRFRDRVAQRLQSTSGLDTTTYKLFTIAAC